MNLNMRVKIPFLLLAFIGGVLSSCKKSTGDSAVESEEFAGGQPSTVVTGANLLDTEADCVYSNISSIDLQTIDCRMIVPVSELPFMLTEDVRSAPTGFTFATGVDVLFEWDFADKDTFTCSTQLGGAELFCSRTTDVFGTSFSVRLLLTDKQNSNLTKTVETNAVEIVSAALSSPDAPTNFSASPLSSQSVGLAWSVSSASEVNIVERSIDNVTFSLVTTVNGLSDSHSDLTVSASSSYYYRIKSCNSVGCSAYANSGIVTTPSFFHLAFVTSNSYNGNLGGLVGADGVCNSLASLAGLGGTWKAILSTSSVNAKDHVSITAEVRNTQGQKLADNATDFWDGSLVNAIQYDENGAQKPGNVWTGSGSAGIKRPETCTSWTTSSGAVDGGFGSATSDDYYWISWTTTQCSIILPFYCISGQ